MSKINTIMSDLLIILSLIPIVFIYNMIISVLGVNVFTFLLFLGFSFIFIALHTILVEKVENIQRKRQD